MCGIVCIWHRDGRPLDPRLIYSQVESLRHRGPDDKGFMLLDSHKGAWAAFGGDNTDAHLVFDCRVAE